MMDESHCPFCDFLSDKNDIVEENEYALALPDAFPVCEGHTLVISRTHEPDFLSLNPEVQGAMLALANKIATDMRAGPDISGINIGINVGDAAGQTVAHAHVHVIPRRSGDVEDPRGGVRWILPSKANYWETPDTQ